MEQIRQLLSQMALNLELNIAMCDKLAEIEGEVTKMKPILDAHSTKIDAIMSRLSELHYKLANDAYMARTGKVSPK